MPRARRRPEQTGARADDNGLGQLGLRAGEAIRWRSGRGARWQLGCVSRRERDGSIGVTDRRGMARSLPIDRLEVACVGGRGAARWEPLVDRMSRSEQLRLL